MLGTEVKNKGVGFITFGIDLLIFVKFLNSTEIGGEHVIVSARTYSVN